MTFDQHVQLWNAIGTWFAGVATFAAVCLSLWLVNRQDKVRLKVYVGVRQMIAGDGSAPREFVMISVTNIGEKPVTITIVGWKIGKRKRLWHRRGSMKLRQCMQTLGDRESDDYPKRLEHGQTANFMVSTARHWPDEFINKFIQSNDPKYLQTLQAQIATSVGQTVYCKPESNVIALLTPHFDSEKVGVHRKTE